MRHDEGAVEEIFRGKIPVGNGVERILRHRRKSEQSSCDFPVDRIARPRESAAAERHDVDPFIGVRKALRVPKEHFPVGIEILRAVDGLRFSQMRISGHDMAYIFFG